MHIFIIYSIRKMERISDNGYKIEYRILQRDKHGTGTGYGICSVAAVYQNL